jgi:hypothetical protein
MKLFALFQSDRTYARFLKLAGVWFLLWLALASIALRALLAAQANPFFYAAF